ncbi:hypothetical protein DP939_25010 [Spongiactinospora rosea]|uniref:Uncharacterized protein n=1 Tax=Spongiactinospora rosea TaxID=2248750 RepID=A0A366LTG3_9ACTN|nr:hypothetical protein DP939_25010 [Spongiactinospora rosea]
MLAAGLAPATESASARSASSDCIPGAPPAAPSPPSPSSQAPSSQAPSSQALPSQVPAPLPNTGREAVRPAFRATADGETAKTITYDDVRLDIGAEALGERTEIEIIPLTERQLPVLGAGMENVTEGPRAGYRFTPTPFEFERDITISLPYDATKLEAAGQTPHA